MNKKIVRIILTIIFFIGVCILTYPFISQYWNSKVQTKAITNYDEKIKDIKNYDSIFNEGNNYNKELFKLNYPLVEYKKISNYKKILNIDNTGMIGYISIDKININLPIYHGTTSSVLNNAVGHLEGTSLPIGGLSTHSVLSAHRGLSSSKLFTNLDKLEIGDIFIITVLNKKLTYQVDNIVIVEPNNIENLKIIENEDLVTLITCTPYGLNTHRLLVQGTRIENTKELELVVTNDAYKIDKLIVSLIITVPILLALILYIIIKPVKKRKKGEL